MKCFIPLLSLLLVLSLMLPLTAFAAEGDDPAAITAESPAGEVLFEGAPDADKVEQLDDYDLVIDHVSVLSVEHNLSAAIPEGYYSVDFMIPDTTEAVFLTGLTSSDVESIQNAIIAAYVHGQPFELTDLGFVDAEKSTLPGDDDLCWAAAASNMLTYAGWAQEAGFNTSDDVFELFISSFTDDGGHAFYGVEWFMNKYFYSDISEGAQLKDSSTGGYFMAYPGEQYMCCETIEGVEGVRDMVAELKAGNAVSINVDLYDNHTGGFRNGHAQTIWGYVSDTAFADTDPAHYLGILITDSDSDKYEQSERRLAPDVMQYYVLSYNESQSFFSFPITKDLTAVLYDYISLVPYSCDLPCETDPAATLSRSTTADLVASNARLTGSGCYDESTMTFAPDNTYTAGFCTANNGGVTYSGRTAMDYTVTDAAGDVVSSNSMTYSLSLPANYITGELTASIPALPVGDYTLTLTTNKNRNGAEAYYMNNSQTISFKVRDTYIVGDTDGSGEITVMDATKVQRYLVQLPAGFDDACAVRADTNGDGIDIMDATNMQRAAAKLSTNPDVGTTRFFE